MTFATSVEIAATATCGVACALLVAAEARGWAELRIIFKVTASLAFLTCGLVAAGSHVQGHVVWWADFVIATLAGLAAGVVGDVALLGRSKRAFAFGLVVFLAGHVAYVLAVTARVPLATWASPFDVLPIAGGGGALVLLWPHLGTLRIAVIAYVATIIAMTIAAIALVHDDPRFTLGAALFFVSDLAVARERFVARSFANKAFGLPIYYAGQLLIAWSLTS